MGRVRRRQAGEGGISEYPTKAGPKFLIKYSVLRDDGRKQVVLKRGFTTRREAAAVLRAEVRKSETGEWVQPSKQLLAAYLAEWLEGQRLSPATLASYRKNVRLVVVPASNAGYHGGRVPGLICEVVCQGGVARRRQGWLLWRRLVCAGSG